VSEVLVVDPDLVAPDTLLVTELGAESIDFLDLIFRLEEWLEVRISIERWDAHLKSQGPPQHLAMTITPEFIAAFAEEVLEAG
jgi:acyl carrier protein